MDFTDLKEKALEAALDPSEVESLLDFHYFQRKMRGESSPGEEPHSYSVTIAEKCERLSRIYPKVNFEPASQQFVAITSKIQEESDVSLVEQIGFVSHQIPYLRTTINFDHYNIRVIFRGDGIGIIKDDSSYEFFEHSLNPDAVRLDCMNDQEAIDDFLRAYFEDTINPRIEDPFFNPVTTGEVCELYFEKGSYEELDRLIRLFILTEPNLDPYKIDKVRIYAGSEDTAPYAEICASQRSERLERLTEIALSENQPIGWSLEYNDGAFYRRSGYDECQRSLAWSFSEILEDAPAREIMSARRELRKWLQERGHDPSKFDAPAKAA